jgi:high affinity sulfate transporter 1
MAVVGAETNPTMMERISRYVPILTWGRSYDSKWLQPDVLAGVTVAAFSVPENMAYASLAGLPPQYGMYASLIALIAYAVFGTSRQLSVGVTSALSIMVAGTLGGMAFADPDEYIAAAGFVAIVAGGLALLAGIFRLGFIVNFISESVLVGFSAGAALFIGSSQLSKLFGIPGVQGNFFERVWNVLKNLGDTNFWNLGLGLISIAALVLLEERLPRLPGALIVVIAAICVMWLSDLEDRGVETAGSIPSGLPVPTIPTVDPSELSTLIGLAFGLFLLSYIEGVGAARTFATKHKYTIDANQELIANGAANLSAGLFQGYNVGGSMSRSAVNDSGGARTPAASLVAAVILAIVLLVLTEPFSYLPEATLAAVVLVAVKGLIDVPAIMRLYRLSLAEFLAAALTFLGVLTLGMLEGIIIGVLFTFLSLLKRVSMPHTAVLGLRPGTSDYVDVAKTPAAVLDERILVFRADAGWFYANAPLIRDQLEADLDARSTPPELVIIDLASAPLIDLGAVTVIGEIKESLDEKRIDLELANVYSGVREMFVRAAPAFGAVPPNESIAEAIERWKHSRSEPAKTDGSHPAGSQA